MATVFTIIGSGNTAWYFAQLLEKAGFSISEIVIRNQKNDHQFSSIKTKMIVRSIGEISQTSDLYLFCVSDDVMQGLIQDFPFKPSDQQICLHTSGLLPAEIFSSLCSKYGCIWPVQSLKRGILPKNQQFPSIVTSSNDETSTQLCNFAQSLGMNAVPLTDDKKARLHLSAVLTGNFINHLLSLGYDYCNGEGIDFSLLHSLIRETVEKSLSSENPSTQQTGPASRHDIKTVQKHMEMLEDHENLKKIYNILTESIMTKHPIK